MSYRKKGASIQYVPLIELMVGGPDCSPSRERLNVGGALEGLTEDGSGAKGASNANGAGIRRLGACWRRVQGRVSCSASSLRGREG